MKRVKTKTNYRVVLHIGKSVANGTGFANNLDEAKQMFDSVRKRTGSKKSELYFEDKLIKRV